MDEIQANSQNNFEDNINKVVKMVKIKQQNNYELIEYIHNIYLHKNQLESLVFVQDQISKYSNFLSKIQAQFNSNILHQNEFIMKCYIKQSNILISSEQKILLKRVTARILQIFQSSNQKVQKFNIFEQEISYNYKQYKIKIIKLINLLDRTRNDFSLIQEIFNVFFEYSNKKFIDQVAKLKKIMMLIENGEIYELQNSLKYEILKQSNPNQKSVYSSKILHSQKIQIKNSTKTSLQKPYSNQIISVKNFTVQKQKLRQKLKIMRRQSKQKQQTRKKMKKFATKYYSLYQNAMQIHKTYFMQDISNLDKKAHSEKMFSLILERNKQNSQFIKQYASICEERKEKYKNGLKQEQFQEKIKLVEDKSDEKQNMMKNQDDLTGYVSSYDLNLNKNEENYHSIISQDLNNNNNNDLKSFRITNAKKTITQSPKSNPNLLVMNACNESYSFIKLNVKNIQTVVNPQRSRLPGIQNRIFSMEDKRKSAKKIMSKDVINNQDVRAELLKSIEKKTIELKGLKKYESGHSQLMIQKKAYPLTLQGKKSSEYVISKKLNKFNELPTKKQLTLTIQK